MSADGRMTKQTCPRCSAPTDERDLMRFRCHDCETEFLAEWPPDDVSEEKDKEWYRQCREHARQKFLAENALD